MNILFGNEMYYLVDFLEKKLNLDVDIYSYKGEIPNIGGFTNNIYELCINGHGIITWIREKKYRYYGLDIELLFEFIKIKYKREFTEFDLFMFEFTYDKINELYEKRIYETYV